MKGQITPKEVKLLTHLASLVPDNGVIVEIGAYCGKSTVSIAKGMKSTVHLYSLDPWVLGPKSTEKQSYETIETLCEYRENIKPYQQQITQIVGWPQNLARIWNHPISMLFIDATKKYESINPIWRDWFPHCIFIVASHDYLPDPESDQYYPGVVKTLEEVVFPNTEFIDHVDYTWCGKVKEC